MTLTSTTIIATTNNMWIKPPMVVLVIKPSNHKIIRTTATVYNIYFGFVKIKIY